jgi:histidinol dehydrogenase
VRILTSTEFLRQRATMETVAVRPEVRDAVERIIAGVRRDGDTALRQLTETLDGVKLKEFRVPAAALEKAWKKTPPTLQKALQLAAKNIKSYQTSLKPGKKAEVQPRPGVKISSEWKPLPAVACYAPGGRAIYPSTVLMMCVTAKVAGVERVILTSPPTRDGIPAPAILAAAHIAGVDEVYALGGAQAVAAFAFGTAAVPRVPKIVGPGNAYVAEAKRQLFGTIGIESIAGPTELAIFADDTADPGLVAVDLAAQAEHDPDARTLLVVPNVEQARAIQQATEELVRTASRSGILATSLLEQGLIVVASSDKDIVACLEAYAPEHVELLCAKPERIANQLRAAGTIFLGTSTPAPFGDYTTGANHVLPTGRSARFASPLSVYDFMRMVVTQKVDAKGAQEIGPAAVEIAKAEGLSMHAEAVRRRLK